MLNETKEKNYTNFNHKAQVKLLSIEQILRLQIGKFMHKFCDNQLLEIFEKYTEIKQIHSYPTRLSCNKNYFHSTILLKAKPI